MSLLASSLRPGVSRRELLKTLLYGASPRNPTYVLGRILSTFTSQGSTELTVYAGEEVFILFELNDWAFVTLFTDTSRRGYIPLDYCDVVQDFYDYDPGSSNTQSKERNPDTQRSPHGHKSPSITNTYLRSMNKKTPTYRVPTVQKTTDEMYSPAATRRQLTNPDSRQCNHVCCCQAGLTTSNYMNIMKYLSQSENDFSHDDTDRESGLGDNESVQSTYDIIKSPSKDGYTQMYGTLDGLESTQPPGISVSCNKWQEYEEPKRRQQHTSLLSPPQESVSSQEQSGDSLLSDSVFDSSMLDCSLHNRVVTSNDRYNSSTSGFLTESTDSETERTERRSLQSDADDDMTDLDTEKAPTSPRARPASRVSSLTSTSGSCVSSLSDELKRRLSLPVLDKGRQPNRVELHQLSQRIKEKLQPTREELLTPRRAAQIGDEMCDVPSSSESDDSEGEENGTELSTTTTSFIEPLISERRERKLTFQAIQEQYAKLEEARLLHNALKQLNEVMANAE